MGTKKRSGGYGCGCFTIIFFLILIVLAILFLPGEEKKENSLGGKLKNTIIEGLEIDAEGIEKGFGKIFNKISGSDSETQTEDENNSGERGNYYYEQLSEEDKSIYEVVSKGISGMDTDITIKNGEWNQVSSIFDAVLMDHPEYFWCDGSTRYFEQENPLLDGSYLILTPVYNCAKSVKETKQAEIDSVVQSCLNGMPQQASEHKKIKYVYEFVVHQTEYDKSASDNQNIYSVFVNKKSVCAGYSKAMQYLLKKTGVTCIYVTGVASGEEHAWNIVKCDGGYYHVDATWGDPVYTDNIGVSHKDRIRYDYFCCSDETIFKTHMIDSGLTVPKCYQK